MISIILGVLATIYLLAGVFIAGYALGQDSNDDDTGTAIDRDPPAVVMVPILIVVGPAAVLADSIVRLFRKTPGPGPGRKS